MYILRKKVQKLKNITFLHFITIFYNFARKTKTGWAPMVLKPILEIRNVNDVFVYVCCTFLKINSLSWLIYLCLKNEGFLNFNWVLLVKNLEWIRVSYDPGGYLYLYNSHILRKGLLQHSEIDYKFAWGNEVSVSSKPFFLHKILTTSDNRVFLSAIWLIHINFWTII